MIPQLCLLWKGQLGRFRNEYTLAHTAPCGDGANLSTWEKMAVRPRTWGEIKHSWDSSASAAQKRKTRPFHTLILLRGSNDSLLASRLCSCSYQLCPAGVRLRTATCCCQFKSSPQEDDDVHRSSVDSMCNQQEVLDRTVSLVGWSCRSSLITFPLTAPHLTPPYPNLAPAQLI